MRLRSRHLLSAVPALLLASILTACGATDPGVDPSTDPTPVSGPSCPEPPSSLYGPAVLLAEAELLGADDLPDGVCAYGSESGGSIWLIAEPYSTDFPDRIAEWLEPLGWTPNELGTWEDGGHVRNLGFTPPAGSDVVVAAAHVFNAYPEKTSFNLGIDQEFLSLYGLEPGDELAIFAAWR